MMRSEQEITDLILRYANNDENIRLVVMNGSRADPQVKKDPFQDFDVACLVRDLEAYKQNHTIATSFGEIMILQALDDVYDPPLDDCHYYSYLMQFVDGRRIDLSFHSLELLGKVLSDTLTIVLLDKDGRERELPPPSDAGYYPVPPSEKSFTECCNEFWWVTPYVAKGLWREQLTYAKYHQEVILRKELMKMMVWYFGVQTNFQRSPGHAGKYLKKYLDPDIWAQLESTYCDSKPEHTWEALLAMGDLFRQTARVVAAHFRYNYPEGEDRRVSEFIRHIRNLPRDAETIY
jgi:aminoglycoside 6-adenylyltransferase